MPPALARRVAQDTPDLSVPPMRSANYLKELVPPLARRPRCARRRVTPRTRLRTPPTSPTSCRACHAASASASCPNSFLRRGRRPAPPRQASDDARADENCAAPSSPHTGALGRTDTQEARARSPRSEGAELRGPPRNEHRSRPQARVRSNDVEARCGDGQCAVHSGARAGALARGRTEHPRGASRDDL